MKHKKTFEAVGAITGIIGALIMSFYPESALVAWSFWLVSSIALLFFAFGEKLQYLLGLQVVFTVINLSGIFNSITRF